MKVLHIPVKNIDDLKAYIADDAKLNQAIKKLDPDVEGFRTKHAVELRKMGYPDVTDFLDAKVKKDKTQEEKYYSDCLKIKERFPK